MFLDIFHKTIQAHALFPSQALIVLAVSGGADSLALLHACATQQNRWNCQFHVATLDHQLRPESASDVVFVQQTASRFGLPCTTGQVDVQTYLDTHKTGLEDAARRARYDFLADVAQSLGTAYIATGHHADDQAETVLMRVLRGTGLTGLTGMRYRAPLSYHESCVLLRPLLDVRRAAIDDYCQAHQLEARQDASNTNTDFLRNAVRHEILPYLREFNPQIDSSLTRMADILSVEDDYLTAQFEQQVRPVMQFDERVTLPVDIFRQWHVTMQRRALREAALYLGSEPAYEHVVTAGKAARWGRVGTESLFPGEVRLRVGYKKLYIEPVDLSLPTVDYLLLPDSETQVSVNLPGTTSVDDWQIVGIVSDDEPSMDYVAYMDVPSDADVLLRSRRPGDRFAPLGMKGHTRSLKKWLIDRKVPQHLRDRLPLLFINNQIAAVILPDEWAISQLFAVSERSKGILYLQVRKMQ